MTDPAERKKALRREISALRRSQSPELRHARSARIQERLLALEAWHAAGTVALYAPLPDEVQVERLWREGVAAGKRILFPEVVEGRVLRFRRADSEHELAGAGKYGIAVASGPEVPVGEIELFVVPGVAFDRLGNRLGRGGGYYDATLALAPAAERIGLAFAFQLVDEVPCAPLDVRMSRVITDGD